MKALHNNKQLKNNNSFDERIQRRHREDLGLDIPEDFFARSKNEILEKTIHKKNKLTLFSQKTVIWSAAAVIAFLLILTMDKKEVTEITNNTPEVVLDSIDQISNEMLTNLGLAPQESDVLMASLFIEDAEVDEFIDRYVLEEVLEDEITSQ